MHNAFISSLSSCSIQQWLLKNKTLDLQTVYMQASTLDLVQQNNELYTTPEAQLATLVNPEPLKVVNPQSNLKNMLWPWFTKLNINASFVGYHS